MFGWLPRWHPFIWLIVVIVVVLVWQDPAGSGQTVRGWLDYIPQIANRVSIFIHNS